MTEISLCNCPGICKYILHYTITKKIQNSYIDGVTAETIFVQWSKKSNHTAQKKLEIQSETRKTNAMMWTAKLKPEEKFEYQLSIDGEMHERFICVPKELLNYFDYNGTLVSNYKIIFDVMTGYAIVDYLLETKAKLTKAEFTNRFMSIIVPTTLYVKKRKQPENYWDAIEHLLRWYAAMHCIYDSKYSEEDCVTAYFNQLEIIAREVFVQI